MSAKRAFSDEGRHSPERYSDDFDSDDEKKTQKQKRTPTPKKSSNHRYYQDKLFGRGSGSLRSQGHSLRKGQGGGRGNSLSSEPADMKKNIDSVATRVLSASRNRINEFKNKIEELNLKIRELEQENKMFKVIQFRQEKTIQTFSDKENDLPSILEKHNNEIRALKDQNRRLREKFEKSDRHLRDAEDELERVKKKMNKYKDICENKELIERDELSRKLATAEQKAEDNEIKVKELQRHIEVLRKSHKHELGIEFARQKDVRKQLEELKESYSQLSNQLKEKDKALYLQNIHCNPRHGKSSRTHSPDSSFSWKTKRKTSSMTELTPREKAKFYSEKQREELYKQKELKDEQDKRVKQKLEQETVNNSSQLSPTEFSLKAIKETLKDTEERARWDIEEKSNNDKEDVTRQKNELQRKPHKDRPTREDREINEARVRDELELKEKNILEKQDRQNKKDEERRRHLESDFFLQEERKKKDEVMKKLTAMNDPFSHPLAAKKGQDQASGYDGLQDSPFPRHSDTLVSTKPLYNTSTHLERQKNKLPSSSEDVAGYKPSFGPTRENIKKPNITTTSNYEVNNDEPAFIITKTPPNTITEHKDKKPNLLESLFGSQASSSKNLPTKKVPQSDPFFIPEKSPHVNNHAESTTNSTFPWETHSDRKKSNIFTSESNRKPNTINGSGTLFSDDMLDSPNKAQVRSQQKQTLMFQTKPSVTAFDNFSDDIEEVVL